MENNDDANNINEKEDNTMDEEDDDMDKRDDDIDEGDDNDYIKNFFKYPKIDSDEVFVMKSLNDSIETEIIL
jgi:hypothetical protein